jgi:hypothetical protein
MLLVLWLSSGRFPGMNTTALTLKNPDPSPNLKIESKTLRGVPWIMHHASPFVKTGHCEHSLNWLLPETPVEADARPQAILAHTPLAVMLAYLRSPTALGLDPAALMPACLYPLHSCTRSCCACSTPGTPYTYSCGGNAGISARISAILRIFTHSLTLSLSDSPRPVKARLRSRPPGRTSSTDIFAFERELPERSPCTGTRAW